MRLLSVVRSEWIKARSIPSVLVSAVLMFLITAGFSAVGSATLGRERATQADFDSLLMSFYGVNFGQLAAICIGALVASAQYKHNGVRVWLTAVPRRGLLYTAQLIVVFFGTFLVGLLTTIACVAACAPILGERGVSFGDAAAYRAIIGGALYLAIMAVFAAGVTMLLRSGFAALAILTPIVLLLSFVLGDVSQGSGVVGFLPDRAGRQVLVADPSGSLGPWAGLAVTAAWAAVATLAGWLMFRRRDA